MPTTSDYPAVYARTKRFTLGAPRTFTVSPDGRRVLFLRSAAGEDPVNALWLFDVDTGRERLLFDPRGAGGDEGVSQAELDRRERVGERAGGITAYAADAEVTKVVFALGGRLTLLDVETGESHELLHDVVADDPRLDPSGRRIAYVVRGALHVLDLERADRVLADEDDPNVTWGLPEFAAAEEMDRHRGHWWSPEGDRLAAARVDVAPVKTWWISDPSHPDRAPRPIRYPQAGTEDAIVSLHVFDVRTGERLDVRWDRDAFAYLGRVDWSEGSPLTILVVSRDQKRMQILEVAADGSTTVVRETSDPEWVDLPSGGPTRISDGTLVTIGADRASDSDRLLVGEGAVTPSAMQVRSILGTSGEGVLFTASEGDPTEISVHGWTRGDGVRRIGERNRVETAAAGGSTVVLTSAGLDEPLPTVAVIRDDARVGTIASAATRPPLEARPRFLALGERQLRAALLLPGGREPDTPVPVLMDPYGGPHFARVTCSQAAHLTSQWLADELGTAVLVVDGRGTPGRGPAWNRAVYRDFTVALEDQVDALRAAAEELGFLDVSRVAMRGWSFGGYLSAMAVLRRPDVFHAAVVGAPVSDLALYDTFYMERYMGTPQDEPEAYRKSSILGDAPGLERPMLLIHGLADDNVVAAHTLRLSAALFEAGRHHELVLLPTGTHRQTNEEAILRLEADFLRRTLGLDDPRP